MLMFGVEGSKTNGTASFAVQVPQAFLGINVLDAGGEKSARATVSLLRRTDDCVPEVNWCPRRYRFGVDGISHSLYLADRTLRYVFTEIRL